MKKAYKRTQGGIRASTQTLLVSTRVERNCSLSRASRVAQFCEIVDILSPQEFDFDLSLPSLPIGLEFRDTLKCKAIMFAGCTVRPSFFFSPNAATPCGRLKTGDFIQVVSDEIWFGKVIGFIGFSSTQDDSYECVIIANFRYVSKTSIGIKISFQRDLRT